MATQGVNVAHTESKVVIVTGGLGGIGAATARLLAESGTHVVLTDIVEAGGAELAAELTKFGPTASFMAADLVDEEQARAVVTHAIERFGRIDGAFNNAGVAQHGKAITELSSSEFEKVMRINVLGTFHCLKHQMQAMQCGGSIVITSSALGLTAFPNRAEYVTSKHALCGLVRAAAVEGAPRAIRVNAVLPGSVATPMVEAMFGSIANAAKQRAGRIHLLERMGEPNEIGYAVRWLLSDESSFMTGAIIPIDGGATAGRNG
jgi:2,5-dichloro-2,5-cyclohexadiene-1,4-diol dehydrogenase 1